MDKQYMVITPARDEERFLPFLIESMARQTVKPRALDYHRRRIR